MKKLLKISPQMIIDVMQKRYLESFTKPEWYQIESGHNKGILIYVNPHINNLFNEMIEGSYDQFLYKNYKQYKNKIVWDIGSHIGYHALGLAKAVGRFGKVYAFEPSKSNIKRINLILSKNKNLSNRIVVKENAIGSKQIKTSLNTIDNVDDGKSSGSYVADSTPPLQGQIYKKFRPQPIQMDTADNITNKYPNMTPDIMKIDVEGYEADVLIGAKKLLKTKKPKLFIEIHHVKAMLEVSKILLPLKYQIKILPDNHASKSRCFIVAQHEK